MKTLVDNGQVTHFWAHKSQGNAHSAGRRMFFDGDTIYSYGTHFPIARHVENKKGVKAILFTTRTYSVTTSGHIGIVRGAISHMENVFRVRNPDATPSADTLAEFGKDIIELLAQARRAKKNKDGYLASAQTTLNKALELAKFFGLRCPFKSLSHFDKAAKISDETYRGQMTQARERAKANEARRQEELAATKEKWIAGETDYVPHGLSEVCLRVKGDELQTSKGARVPLSHAARAFKLIKNCRDNERSWMTNGHTCHVGAFQVDSIDTQGNIKAGCHNITWSEIERIAKLQKWIN